MERLTNIQGLCIKCIGCIEESNCEQECDAIEKCIMKLKEYEDLGTIGLIEQYRWERDIAIQQLESIGLSLGQTTDEVKNAIRIAENIKKVESDLEEERVMVMHIINELFDNCNNDLEKYVLNFSIKTLQSLGYLLSELY